MLRLELTASVYREQIGAIIGAAEWIVPADATSKQPNFSPILLLFRSLSRQQIARNSSVVIKYSWLSCILQAIAELVEVSHF